MPYPFQTNRVDGVSYKPWSERVVELCEENEVDPPHKDEFYGLYQANFTYEEAVMFCRFKKASRVFMEITVKDDKGYFKTSFPNAISAKVFFKKFPEIRKMFEGV